MKPFKTFLLLVILLLLCGCKEMAKSIKGEMDHINVTYMIDPNTNLCFAYFRGWGEAGLANVPCSDEVLIELHSYK